MPTRRTWLRWGLPFVLWSVPAALLTALSRVDAHRPLGQAFLREGLPWYYWAVATPLIVSLARRYPFESLRTWRGSAVHASAALLAGMVHGLLTGMIYVSFVTPEAGTTAAQMLVRGTIFWMLFGLIFYTTVASVGFALVYQERLRERELATSRLEARLVEAQLSTLRMQLQPHFLFNSLNTVAMFVRDGDRHTAVRLITRLSELLRHLLDDGNVQEVPLHTELEQVRRYLELEGARFSDRLRFELLVPNELADAFVPNLLLQPLVENAIQHGLASRASAGLIELSAQQRNGRIELVLRNEGPPLPANFDPELVRGIGLRNSTLRLQHLYGKAAELRISDWERGVRIDITLPYHTRPIELQHG